MMILQKKEVINTFVRSLERNNHAYTKNELSSMHES